MAKVESNSEEFKRRLRNFAKGTGKAVEERLRGAVVKVTQRVMEQTPVDTGRARAGFSAPLDELGVPWEFIGSGENDALEEGTAASDYIEEFKTDTKKVTVWNHVLSDSSEYPYVLRLEYGWSAQAPEGMVRISLRALKEEIGEDIKQAVIEEWGKWAK